MKQVFSTSKGIKVIEVPPPLLEKGNILVEVSYSFISSGTEMATLKAMEPKGFSDNLIQSKERLKKLVKFFNEKGIKKTISIISQRITADETTSNRLVPIGYCCSGTIVAIGEGEMKKEFRVATWMARQYEDFKEWLKFHGADYKIIVYGEGLIPHYCRMYSSQVEQEEKVA